MKKLLILNGLSRRYGILPPKKPAVPKKPEEKVETVPTAISVDESKIVEEKVEPLLIEQEFFEEALTPASRDETVAFYQRLREMKAVPDGCYWFYVQPAEGETNISIYHFGLKFGVGSFFTGTAAFDWNRNGGTVYKIKDD